MNTFLQDYYSRLRDWFKLRENLRDQNLETICIAVDRFWQQCPLINHYLHPADIKDWPSPWELISDNTYCCYARGLGMVYTLQLLGIKNIDFVDAIDDNNENVVLVLVDKRYILNYWPNTVTTNKLSDFTITNHISIEMLERKIG